MAQPVRRSISGVEQKEDTSISAQIFLRLRPLEEHIQTYIEQNNDTITKALDFKQCDNNDTTQSGVCVVFTDEVKNSENMREKLQKVKKELKIDDDVSPENQQGFFNTIWSEGQTLEATISAFYAIYWPQVEINDSIPEPFVFSAYGESGTGKTYNLFGPQKQTEGIIPTFIARLQKCVENKHISYCMFEQKGNGIYNAMWPKQSRNLSFAGERNILNIKLEYSPIVPNFHDLNKTRTANNGIHKDSSRSHAFIIIKYETNTNKRYYVFMDLAGYEGATGYKRHEFNMKLHVWLKDQKHKTWYNSLPLAEQNYTEIQSKHKIYWDQIQQIKSDNANVISQMQVNKFISEDNEKLMVALQSLSQSHHNTNQLTLRDISSKVGTGNSFLVTMAILSAALKLQDQPKWGLMICARNITGTVTKEQIPDTSMENLGVLYRALLIANLKTHAVQVDANIAMWARRLQTCESYYNTEIEEHKKYIDQIEASYKKIQEQMAYMVTNLATQQHETYISDDDTKKEMNAVINMLRNKVFMDETDEHILKNILFMALQVYNMSKGMNFDLNDSAYNADIINAARNLEKLHPLHLECNTLFEFAQQLKNQYHVQHIHIHSKKYNLELFQMGLRILFLMIPSQVIPSLLDSKITDPQELLRFVLKHMIKDTTVGSIIWLPLPKDDYTEMMFLDNGTDGKELDTQKQIVKMYHLFVTFFEKVKDMSESQITDIYKSFRQCQANTAKCAAQAKHIHELEQKISSQEEFKSNILTIIKPLKKQVNEKNSPNMDVLGTLKFIVSQYEGMKKNLEKNTAMSKLHDDISTLLSTTRDLQSKNIKLQRENEALKSEMLQNNMTHESMKQQINLEKESMQQEIEKWRLHQQTVLQDLTSISTQTVIKASQDNISIEEKITLLIADFREVHQKLIEKEAALQLELQQNIHKHIQYLSEIQVEKQKVEQQMSDVQTQLKTTQQSLEQNMETLAQNRRQHEQELKYLEQQNDELKAAQKQLQEAKADAEARNAELELQLTQRQEEIAKLNTEKAQIEATLAATNETLQAAQKKASETETQLAIRTEEFKKGIQDLEVQETRLKQDILQLQEEKKTWENNTSAIQDSKMVVEGINNMLKIKEQEQQQLQEKVKHLEKEQETITKISQAEQKRQQDKIAALKVKQRQLIEEAKQQKEILYRTAESLRDLDNIINRDMDVKSKQENMIARLKTEIDKLKQSKAECESQYADTNKRLSDQIVNMHQEIDSLKTALRASEERLIAVIAGTDKSNPWGAIYRNLRKRKP